MHQSCDKAEFEVPENLKTGVWPKSGQIKRESIDKHQKRGHSTRRPTDRVEERVYVLCTRFRRSTKGREGGARRGGGNFAVRLKIPTYSI